MSYELFKGKKVVIYKVDKRVKYGKLIAIEQNFIGLEFNDGTIITISRDEIEDIKEDTKTFKRRE